MKPERLITPPDTTDLLELETYYDKVQKEAQTTLEHIRGVKAITSKNGKEVPATAAATTKLKVPPAYQTELGWDERVLWAVNELGAGFVPDILKKLMSADATIDEKRGKNAVTYTASKLFRSKVLKAKRVGKKYKYSIKLKK